MKDRKKNFAKLLFTVYLVILFFLSLVYIGWINLDSAFSDDIFGTITLLTSIALFILLLILQFIANWEKAFIAALIGAGVLFVINPLLGFPALPSVVSIYVADLLSDSRPLDKKRKSLVAISFYYFVISFGILIIRTKGPVNYLSEFYAMGIYKYTAVLFTLFTAAFIGLLLRFRFIKKRLGKIYNTLIKAAPYAFCLWLLLLVYGVYLVMARRANGVETSTTLTALALSLIKAAKFITAKIKRA